MALLEIEANTNFWLDHRDEAGHMVTPINLFCGEIE